MLDLELKLAINLMAFDAAHVLDNVMRAKTLDLLTLMRRADGDDSRTGCDGGFDT